MPDSFLKLITKVQFIKTSWSSNQKSPILLSWLTCQIRTFQPILVHSNTDLPLFPLKMTSTKLFAAVSAWFRFNYHVFLPWLIKDLFMLEIDACLWSVPNLESKGKNHSVHWFLHQWLLHPLGHKGMYMKVYRKQNVFLRRLWVA